MKALYWIVAVWMVLYSVVAAVDDGELTLLRVVDMLFSALVAWLLIRTVV